VTSTASGSRIVSPKLVSDAVENVKSMLTDDDDYTHKASKAKEQQRLAAAEISKKKEEAARRDSADRRETRQRTADQRFCEEFADYPLQTLHARRKPEL